MRWFIGILIALNLGILAWGWLGDKDEPAVELAAPGVGTIRLVDEQPAVPAPAAVPIPAPPRENGAVSTKAEAQAQPGGDASAAPAITAAAPEARPLDQADTLAPAEPQPPEPAAPATASDTTPVISAPEPAFVPEPEVAPRPKAVKHCQRIGPFADAAAAKAIRTALAKRGTVDSEQVAGPVPVGHWVLVPPQASRSAALAIADRLKRKGFKDLWVISKGEATNGISLGVFSQPANADRFAARARAKGFDVEVRLKTKPGQQTWLNYQGDTAIQPADLPSTRGVTITAQGCP